MECEAKAWRWHGKRCAARKCFAQVIAFFCLLAAAYPAAASPEYLEDKSSPFHRKCELYAISHSSDWDFEPASQVVAQIDAAIEEHNKIYKECMDNAAAEAQQVAKARAQKEVQCTDNFNGYYKAHRLNPELYANIRTAYAQKCADGTLTPAEELK